MFQVGEVSRRLALNPQTLYFYERIGLIPPPERTEAGYRLFSQQDMERLAFIVRTKSLGLSLDEIKEILALKDGQSLTCRAVYERLSKKLQEIEENIRQLQALHDELTPLVKRCQENLQASDKACVVLDHPQGVPLLAGHLGNLK
jgi:DNA-binding transcriptional MerR regulator